MFKVLILVLALVDAGLVFVISLLAVHGDGSPGEMPWVLGIGLAWVGACTFAALRLGRKGLGVVGVGMMLAALPVAYVLLQQGVRGWTYWESVRPNSAAFDAACEDAATTFITPPSRPVKSIAFDWQGPPPRYSHFSVDERGNVDGLRTGHGRYPAAIAFVESRCCRFEGGPTNGVGPYIRRPNPGHDYFGVADLTADIVVHLASQTVEKREDGALVRNELIVIDRRDGKRLATMRYYLDDARRRGCVAGGLVDEAGFALKAAGLAP